MLTARILPYSIISILLVALCLMTFKVMQISQALAQAELALEKQNTQHNLIAKQLLYDNSLNKNTIHQLQKKISHISSFTSNASIPSADVASHTITHRETCDRINYNTVEVNPYNSKDLAQEIQQLNQFRDQYITHLTEKMSTESSPSALLELAEQAREIDETIFTSEMTNQLLKTSLTLSDDDQLRMLNALEDSISIANLPDLLPYLHSLNEEIHKQAFFRLNQHPINQQTLPYYNEIAATSQYEPIIINVERDLERYFSRN